MILGGYRGFFGSPKSNVVSKAELLHLNQSLSLDQNNSWCVVDVPDSQEDDSFPDGAVAAYVNSIQHALSSPNMTVSHRMLHERVLVCGGADSMGNITDACRWYWPPRGTWAQVRGFHMHAGAARFKW